VEVNGSGKHSSLLQYGNNYCHKKFFSTDPRKETQQEALTPVEQHVLDTNAGKQLS
jgi:hypothetical protein